MCNMYKFFLINFNGLYYYFSVGSRFCYVVFDQKEFPNKIVSQILFYQINMNFFSFVSKLTNLL